MIGDKVINVTLTITNKECNEDDQAFWQSLKKAVTDNTFIKLYLFIYLFILLVNDVYKSYRYVYSQVSCKQPPLMDDKAVAYERWSSSRKIKKICSN